MQSKKQWAKHTFSPRCAHTTAPVLLFCCHFVLTYIHPPASVICPWHACPAQQGSPGRTNPRRRLCSGPTIPAPSPLPIPLCLPPCPCLYVPASLPYDLDADKTRGPAVPSAWCQHFPLIQSLSCCVTDGIGDQKQLPSPQKKEYLTIGPWPKHTFSTVCSAFLTIRSFF